MAKPKIIKGINVQKYAKDNLSKVLNSFDKIYINRTDKIRQTVEKDVKTNLTPYLKPSPPLCLMTGCPIPELSNHIFCTVTSVFQ